MVGFPSQVSTDGCFTYRNELAGGGDLIRNHRGKWIRGFSVKLGAHSAIEAELWALLRGLRLA